MTYRDDLRRRYPGLYEALAEILFRHDPVGIDLEAHPEEYEPEVDAVLPRLAAANGIDDLTPVLFEEFVRRFGSSAGRLEYYEPIAIDVWQAWQQFSRASQSRDQG